MGISMKRSKSKAGKALVGLDLDPSHVAAAEVNVNGGISVKRGAVSPLSPGVLRDGEVADAAALTQVIKAMWAEHDLPKTVRLGLANQRIVVRTLDLPPLTDEKALASAVRIEAPDHIPMPMDEAVLDFQSLGLVDTPAGQRTRVVVVAVRRDMVERYMEAVAGAGLKVQGIDLSAFALVRSMYNAGLDGEDGLLYVNVAGLTNVAVTSGSHCLFTRAAGGGLESIVQALADRRGLTSEHANQWIQHVGMEQPVETIDGDPEVVAATRVVLEEGVHQLADTVRNSLNFYRMQDNATPVNRAVLTGPAVGIAGFADRLSAEIGMPIQARTVSSAGEQGDASRLAVAAGLAVDGI